MWPDWVIFYVLRSKFYFKSRLFEKDNFKRKTAQGYFWTNFCKNLDYFLLKHLGTLIVLDTNNQVANHSTVCLLFGGGGLCHHLSVSNTSKEVIKITCSGDGSFNIPATKSQNGLLVLEPCNKVNWYLLNKYQSALYILNMFKMVGSYIEIVVHWALEQFMIR